MRILSTAAVVLLMTGCASQYKPTFPQTDSSEPVSVYVKPALYQEEVGVQVVVQDSSNATAQYGLIGALVGAAIDAAINNSRAKKSERKAEVVREATTGYDLTGHLESVLDFQQRGETWRVVSVSDTTVALDIRDQVKEVFAAEDVDRVLVMYASYEMVPDLTQVAVTLTQQLYTRPETSSRSPKLLDARSFFYQSPQRELGYRDFLDGERDRIKADITEEYERSIAMQPDEEASLRKSLAAELKELDEAEQIPEAVAIAETWPGVLIEGYLNQAKAHLNYLVLHDWNDTANMPMDKEGFDTFNVVNAIGYRANLKGQRIHQMDENAFYRGFDGTLYSVPMTAP